MSDETTETETNGTVKQLEDRLKQMEELADKRHIQLRESQDSRTKMQEAVEVLLGVADLTVTKEKVIEVLQGTNPCDIYNLGDYSSEIGECVELDYSEIAYNVQGEIDISDEVRQGCQDYLDNSDFSDLISIDVADEFFGNASPSDVPGCWWNAISEALLEHDDFIEGMTNRLKEDDDFVVGVVEHISSLMDDGIFASRKGYLATYRTLNDENRQALQYYQQHLAQVQHSDVGRSRGLSTMLEAQVRLDHAEGIEMHKSWEEGRRVTLRTTGYCSTCGAAFGPAYESGSTRACNTQCLVALSAKVEIAHEEALAAKVTS